MASFNPHCTNSFCVLNKLGQSSTIAAEVLVTYLSLLEDTTIGIERGIGRAPGKEDVYYTLCITHCVKYFVSL